MEIFSTILKIIFIVFFFGFCVFIHELGHLLAALWQGLHVEKFSIGMGPKIWGFKYRGVEYVVSWLPFGGYVSLPQLDPTDTPKTSDDRELPHVPARARAITAFAGPFFNVLFGFVLATAMWAAGLWMPAKSSAVIVDTVPTFLPHVVEGIEPDDIILSIEGRKAPENSNTRWDDLAYIWGEIFAEKHPHPEKISLRIRQASTGEVKDVEVVPAYNPEWEAGLRRGDRITSVNGRKFETGVDDFRQEYVYNKSSRLQMTVVTGEETREVSYTPAPNPRMENLGYPFFHFSNPAKVGDVVQESIAWNAGMRAGDQLFALNGTNINSIYLLGKNLQKLQGQEVIFTVGRGRETMKLAPMALPAHENLSFSTIGISFKVLAAEVVPGSPAAAAGILAGDEFIRIDLLDAPGGKVLSSVQVVDMESFSGTVRESSCSPLRILLRRNGTEMALEVTPKMSDDQNNPRPQVGVVLSNSMPKVLEHVNPWRQFSTVMGTTCRTLGLLFRPITSRVSSVVTGKPVDLPSAQIGVKHMSGPPGILLMLWMKLKTEGYRGGFAFIILITFSLAFMNLLPLPVLDGGHICFAALEGITRRRIPARFFKYIYNFFAYLLIALMLYIMVFDGKRVWRIAGSGKDEAPPVQKEEPAEKSGAESGK